MATFGECSVIAIDARLAPAKRERLDRASESLHFLPRPVSPDKGSTQIVFHERCLFRREEIAGAFQLLFEMLEHAEELISRGWLAQFRLVLRDHQIRLLAAVPSTSWKCTIA